MLAQGGSTRHRAPLWHQHQEQDTVAGIGHQYQGQGTGRAPVLGAGHWQGPVQTLGTRPQQQLLVQVRGNGLCDSE